MDRFLEADAADAMRRGRRAVQRMSFVPPSNGARAFGEPTAHTIFDLVKIVERQEAEILRLKNAKP